MSYDDRRYNSPFRGSQRKLGMCKGGGYSLLNLLRYRGVSE